MFNRKSKKMGLPTEMDSPKELFSLFDYSIARQQRLRSP